MDTIDIGVMAEAREMVERMAKEHRLQYVHTVTIELNGQHGGADVIVKGFTGNDVSLYNEVTVYEVMK